MIFMTGQPPGPQQDWDAALQREPESVSRNKAGNADIYTHSLTERIVLRRSVTLLLSKNILFAT